MTINKLLLALVSLLGLVLLWIVASAIMLPEGGSDAVASPRIGAGPRADAASVAHLAEITGDARLASIAGLKTILGTDDLSEVSSACVAALTRRGDQLRRNPHLIAQGPTTPSASDDSCNAAENAALLGADLNSMRGRPPISARRFRLLSQASAVWLNHDVRNECAPWLDPTRLNLEDADMQRRMWCG